jgi:glutamate-ammonia-ligase adenylyltransferase
VEHGHRHPDVRHSNTLAALTALERTELLPRPEAEGLLAAYRLLRLLIDALRVERGHAKDLVLPAADSPAFEVVCRRVQRSPEGLLGEVEATMGWVAYFFRSRFGAVE